MLMEFVLKMKNKHNFSNAFKKLSIFGLTFKTWWNNVHIWIKCQRKSIKCYNIHSTWFKKWNIKSCAKLWATKMFNILIEQLVRLQILEETPGSVKAFFLKYHT